MITTTAIILGVAAGLVIGCGAVYLGLMYGTDTMVSI